MIDNIVSFESNEHEFIISWIETCIKKHLYTDDYDLHLDEINSKYENDELWLESSLELLFISNQFLQFKFPEFISMVYVPLLSNDLLPIGINFQNIDGIRNQLSITPPSLAVKINSNESLYQILDIRQLIDTINYKNLLIDMYYYEALVQNGNEYYRNLLFIESGNSGNVRIG